ncbi:unnamed protein product [Penicillium egyptiacum]|uniref:Uncharacterized protein n=1 Tax=Penicillium egyptiacum TaxID=1303716 RepID=A0A9W4P9Z2_9EURO|nr:unnamed protein product [Penicillium egyptiacum]
MVADLETLPRLGMIESAFPTLLQLASHIPLPYFRDAMQAGNRIAVYADQLIMAYRDSATRAPSNLKPTLFTKLFHVRCDDLSDINIASEAQGYIAVCRNDEIQKALVRELDTLPSSFGDDELKKLQFLNHVVNGSLLLYATNPSSRPRNPPSPGADLGDHWIPSGVTVSTQAYSLHRDSSVFPDPESFNPWRWASTTKEMKRAFMPFGLHLAIWEIRLGAAYFFRAFPDARMSTRDNMSDFDMQQVCYFIISPQGKRCLIESMPKA